MMLKKKKKEKEPVPVNEKKIDLSGGLVLKYTVILLLQTLALYLSLTAPRITVMSPLFPPM